MSQFAWIFQAGKPVTKEIAATAGNVDTTLTVPAGKRWLVLYGRIRLTTDANAANRIPTIQYTDGTNILFENIWSVVVASSTNIDKFFWQEGDATNAKYISVPASSILEAVDELKIVITAGLAGDSYTGFIRILEIDAP